MKNNKGITLIKLIIIIITILAIGLVGVLVFKKNNKGSAIFSDGTTLNWEELKKSTNANKYGYKEGCIGDTTVGEGAFRYCDKLTSIILPDSIMSIEEEAFRELEGHNLGRFKYMFLFSLEDIDNYSKEDGIWQSLLEYSNEFTI